MIDIKKFENVPFESLVGIHKLDAVDRASEPREDEWSGIGSAQCLRFRLDGKVYVALEDPEDGYRSSMGATKVRIDRENLIAASKKAAKNFPTGHGA